MNKSILSTVAVAIVMAIIGFIAGQKASDLTDLERANYNTLPYKIELIRAYDYHYKNVEKLLDSICKDTDSYFYDELMESDVYYEYELSKRRVDTLVSLEQ